MARLRKNRVPTGKFRRGYGRFPRGAVVSPGSAAAAGEAAAGIGVANQALQVEAARQRRKQLLTQAIRKGQLSLNNLSRSDASLLGLSKQQDAAEQLGIDVKFKPSKKSVGGFLGNLLGERGLEGAITHLPGGIVEAGKSIVHDIEKSTLGKAGAVGGFALGGPVGLLLGGAVGGGLERGGKSEVFKNVLKPVGESYAYTYGGKGAQGKNFLERFYEAPLGPILDVATVASLGLGGAARAGTIASRAARGTAPVERLGATPELVETRQGLRAQPLDIQELGPIAARVQSFGDRLASITSHEGRREARPLEIDPDAADFFAHRKGIEGIEAPGVPTRFSNRPLMKYLIQKPFDFLAGSRVGRMPIKGVGRSLEGLRDVWMTNRWQNVARSKVALKSQLEIQRRIKPLVQIGNKLSPEEGMAWFLSSMGITSKTKLMDAVSFWQRSRAREAETGAVGVEHGISRDYLDFLSELDLGGPNADRLIELVTNPTPGMVKLDRAWEGYLKEIEPLLVDENGVPLIDEQEHLRRVWMVRKTLSNADTLEGARTAFETWRYNQGLYKLKEVEKDLDLTDLDEAGKEAIRDYGYPIKPKYVPHVEASGLEFGPRPSFRQRLSGEEAFPQFHGGRRHAPLQIAAQEALQQPFQPYLQEANGQLFRAGAIRMDVRVLVNAASQVTRDLIENDFNSRNMAHVAVSEVKSDGTRIPREFKNQTEVNYATGKKSNEIVWVPKVMRKYYEGHVDALAVLARGLKDLEKQGVRLDNMDIDGIQPILKQLEQHAGAFTKDFVGTAEATGYAVPRAYLDKALQHAKAAEGLTSSPWRQWASLMNVWRTWVLALMPRWWINTAVGSFFMATVHGTWEPKTFWLAQKLMRGRASSELQQLFDQYAAHVRLGGVAGAERLEPGRAAGQAIFPTRKLYDAVQHIEDYFRTAAFIKQLKREERHSMEEISDSLSTFTPFRFWAEDEKHIAQLMGDPILVDAAVDEVNRFFYNYLQLGPQERLYVRQFIPFWGWYKFITKFVWRLPVAYPGRANIIAHLGMVGQEQEEELGILPDYLKGAIFLNKDTKHLKFISTFGVNPMAQFANPYSIRGGLPGLVNLSQFNPAIQAGLQGFGISTLGGESGIAPDAGLAQDFLGRWVDTRQGKEVDLSQRRSFQRFLGSLLRSVPQVRLGEMAVGAHGEVTTPAGRINLPVIRGTAGRPVYPESIPFLREKPIPVREETRRNLADPLNLLLAYGGIQPRTRNIRRDQALLRKSLKYARTKSKRDIKRYKRGVSK